MWMVRNNGGHVIIEDDGGEQQFKGDVSVALAGLGRAMHRMQEAHNLAQAETDRLSRVKFPSDGDKPAWWDSHIAEGWPQARQGTAAKTERQKEQLMRTGLNEKIQRCRAREAIRASRSDAQQIHILDKRLGNGVGAKRERTRLANRSRITS